MGHPARTADLGNLEGPDPVEPALAHRQAARLSRRRPLGMGDGPDVPGPGQRLRGGVEVGGPTGLEPIAAAAFAAADLPVAKGLPLEAYRVQREGWTLRISPAERTAAPVAGETRVALADLVAVVAADGSTWGLAHYEIEPRPGPFLAVVLPAGAEAVGAALDDRPTRPLRGVAGRWWVPLSDNPGRVVLLWRAGPIEPDRAGGRPIPLPALEQDRVPTLVTVRAPEALALSRPPAPPSRSRARSWRSSGSNGSGSGSSPCSGTSIAIPPGPAGPWMRPSIDSRRGGGTGGPVGADGADALDPGGPPPHPPPGQGWRRRTSWKLSSRRA